MRRVLALHTSTHAPEESTSASLVRAALDEFAAMAPRVEIRWIDAAKLHIVPNLSCYASGKANCGSPGSGPYRCWAHFNSAKDPAKYGGVDEMPMIYDGLAWADTVIFSTSTRWGSHSALAQKIIERMDTLENRATSFGEPYPLRGKRLGIIAAGLHWKTADVGRHLQETLRWWGFATQPDDSNVLAWQRSRDPFFEHPSSDLPTVERWEQTATGRNAIRKFCTAVASATHVTV